MTINRKESWKVTEVNSSGTSTSRRITRRPDLEVVYRRDNQCFIIDIAVSNDSGIFEKEKEKIEKYQDLRREIAKLWSIKTSVVPIVVGALGTVTNNQQQYNSNKR